MVFSPASSEKALSIRKRKLGFLLFPESFLGLQFQLLVLFQYFGSSSENMNIIPTFPIFHFYWFLFNSFYSLSIFFLLAIFAAFSWYLLLNLKVNLFSFGPSVI